MSKINCSNRPAASNQQKSSKTNTPPTIKTQESHNNKMFSKLNEYKFPSDIDSEDTITDIQPTGSTDCAVTTSGKEPIQPIPPSPTCIVSFQDFGDHRVPIRRCSHKRSINTVNGSSTDSIFSDLEYFGSRYSSIVSGNFSKNDNDNFEDIYDKSSSYKASLEQQEQGIFNHRTNPRPSSLTHLKYPKTTSSIPQLKTHELIDLDIVSKPLRPRMKTYSHPFSSCGSMSFPSSTIPGNIDRMKSLGTGIQDETIHESDSEDVELDLIEFLRESTDDCSKNKIHIDVSGNIKQDIDMENNPFKHIYFNKSIDFDPTSYKY